MSTVNISKARSSLSRLIAAIETGRETEVVITRNGRPAARLVPITAAPDAGRRLGLLAGQYPPMTLEAFDAENERVAALFSGEAT
ncbi:type II toxin-antitoxin system Phd/YefM family antitoxin [Inquilinus sp. Marseille-Q2685]|uniref:type II toxin-antitoxin system Phd/YefM family antitoxin n=1 Tax=Inquilinus sp. Marseille-Q2685 TaxID=2866581 RepID=UPI001CE3C42F|nr:type II toxin-antitoxin system Phd/YefM family antitoxin [Inquilinus sp. Marseille-Q2685]